MKSEFSRALLKFLLNQQVLAEKCNETRANLTEHDASLKQDLLGISPFSHHSPSELNGLFQGPFTHAISVEETRKSFL